MNALWRTWMLIGLGAAVLIAAIYFPILRRRVKREAKIQQESAEQARRELAQAIVQNSSDPVVKAKVFWASSEQEIHLPPLNVDLALSAAPLLPPNQAPNTFLPSP